MKVELDRPKPLCDRAIHGPGFGFREFIDVVAIKASLPFFMTTSKPRLTAPKRVHRVRSAMHHLKNRQYSHTSVEFWCHGGGFAKVGQGHFFAHPPGEFPVCRKCEMAAIKSGKPTSPELIGGLVTLI